MQCLTCHYENRQGVKHCTRCGKSLPDVEARQICGTCGFQLFEEDVFCGNCGSEVPFELPAFSEAGAVPAGVKAPARSKAMESERKNVTVLFADIAGFTELSSKLDPEDVTALMNGCLTLLADIVVKYHGYIDKFIGDCIMAIFGAPIAHENDPELAVRAALEMRRAMTEYNKSIPITLERKLMLHIGINSGIVIAGGVGSHQKMEYTVMGDTVNLASRLESIAGDGQIYASKYTYNLTRNLFEFAELDPIRVKGKKDPVAAYEVIRALDIQAAGTGGNHRAPIIGRTAELRKLKSRVDKMKKGTSQVVFLLSQAGVGKTRLKSELTDIAGKQVQVLDGSCHSFARSTSYFMFSQMFKTLLDVDSEDLPDAIAKKVSINLPLLIGADHHILSIEEKEAIVFIGAILGLDMGEEYDVPVSHMDSEDVKFSVFRAVRWFFERISESEPLLIVFEDVHYADTISIELMTYLFETIKRKRIMMLVLMRPQKEYASHNLPAVAKSKAGARYTEVVCERLDARDSAKLVKSLLKTSKVQDGILKMIHSRADGNPFYIEEIVKDIVDNDLISIRNGEARMEGNGDVMIPNTIQGMIASRIDKLPNTLKDILQIASVIGPVFKYDLLREVLGEPYSEGLEKQLRQLEEREMIFESKTFPEVEFSFKNILTQEAGYASLLHKKQREFHGNVALKIKNLFRDRIDEYLEVLAMHFHNARAYDEAFEYDARSGLKAQKIFSNKEAIYHLKRAISIEDKVGKPAFSPYDLYIAYSEVNELTGDLKEAVKAREKAIKLTKDRLQKAESMRNIGRILEKQGSKEKALALYQRIFPVLKGHGESLEMGRLLMNQSWVLNRMRRFDEAIDKCSKALKIFESKNARSDIAQAHNNLAVIFESKGYLDLALEHNEKSVKLFSSLNHKRKVGNAYMSIGYVYAKRNELKKALSFFEKALTVMGRIGNRYGTGSVLMAKGRCYSDMGRLDEAESALLQAIQIHEDLALTRKTAANALSLGRVYLEKNDKRSAKRFLAVARKTAASEGYHSDLARVALLETELLIAEGKKPDAKFREAIKIFKSIGRERDASVVVKSFEAYRKKNSGKPSAPVSKAKGKKAAAKKSSRSPRTKAAKKASKKTGPAAKKSGKTSKSRKAPTKKRASRSGK